MKTIIKYYKFTRCFFKLLGCRNWYVKIDKPNLYQWIYKWRISPKTAYECAKIIWLN
jgi:hypothetical protein